MYSASFAACCSNVVDWPGSLAAASSHCSCASPAAGSDSVRTSTLNASLAAVAVHDGPALRPWMSTVWARCRSASADSARRLERLHLHQLHAGDDQHGDQQAARTSREPAAVVAVARPRGRARRPGGVAAAARCRAARDAAPAARRKPATARPPGCAAARRSLGHQPDPGSSLDRVVLLRLRAGGRGAVGGAAGCSPGWAAASARRRAGRRRRGPCRPGRPRCAPGRRRAPCPAAAPAAPARTRATRPWRRPGCSCSTFSARFGVALLARSLEPVGVGDRLRGQPQRGRHAGQPAAPSPARRTRGALLAGRSLRRGRARRAAGPAPGLRLGAGARAPSRRPARWARRA